jgi:hypothetical protein
MRTWLFAARHLGYQRATIGWLICPRDNTCFVTWVADRSACWFVSWGRSFPLIIPDDRAEAAN